MKVKKLGLLALTGFATTAIISCGGGGGGGSVSSTKASYSGAASQGDLATFTFDGKNLTYQISGPVFGNIPPKTIQLIPVQNGENFVYKDKWDDYYYFSGNLGVAEIYLTDSDKATYVVGLKSVQIPDVNTVAGNSTEGKKYIYIYIPRDIINDDIEGYLLTIKPDHTWQLSDGASGNWKIVENHVEAYDSDGNKVANVIIKPGQSRAGIIVDINPAFGGGFGIGLEQKPLKPEDLTGVYQTYYYYLNATAYYNATTEEERRNAEIECFGKLYVNGNTYTYIENWCSDGEPDNVTVSNIKLNQLCDGTPMNGVACADGYNIFVDPEDGYFIAIRYRNKILEEVIGSSKSWNK
jgi:hypothetical protein